MKKYGKNVIVFWAILKVDMSLILVGLKMADQRGALMPLNNPASAAVPAPNGPPLVGATSPDVPPSTGRSVLVSIWATTSPPLHSCCAIVFVPSCIYPYRSIHRLTTPSLSLSLPLWGQYLTISLFFEKLLTSRMLPCPS